MPSRISGDLIVNLGAAKLGTTTCGQDSRSAVRRQDRRRDLHADVMVLFTDGQQRPFWAVAQDIGPHGVFLSTTHSVELDTPVVLRIMPRNGLCALRAKAQIVHRISGVGFGCQFIDIGTNNQQLLNRWIAEQQLGL